MSDDGGVRALIVAAVLTMLLAGCSGASPVEDALSNLTCGDSEYATIEDDGQSLYLDGEGAEADGLGPSALACYIGALDTPDSVIRRMENTTAMQGVQEASWGGMTARWTYHPDDGLDVIVETDEDQS